MSFFLLLLSVSLSLSLCLLPSTKCTHSFMVMSSLSLSSYLGRVGEVSVAWRARKEDNECLLFSYFRGRNLCRFAGPPPPARYWSLPKTYEKKRETQAGTVRHDAHRPRTRQWGQAAPPPDAAPDSLDVEGKAGHGLHADDRPHKVAVAPEMLQHFGSQEGVGGTRAGRLGAAGGGWAWRRPACPARVGHGVAGAALFFVFAAPAAPGHAVHQAHASEARTTGFWKSQWCSPPAHPRPAKSANGRQWPASMTTTVWPPPWALPTRWARGDLPP